MLCLEPKVRGGAYKINLLLGYVQPHRVADGSIDCCLLLDPLTMDDASYLPI